MPRMGALYAFVILLLTLSCFFIYIDRLKYPLYDYYQNHGAGLNLLHHAITLLTTLDYSLLIIAFLAFAMVFWRESKRGELSSLLLQAKPKHIALLLAALLIWFGHAYLIPGYLLGGDIGSHVARTAHVRMGLEQGHFIFWDNYFYIGSPFLQFTGPFYFWLTGGLDLIFRNANFTTKLSLLALHIAGGAFFYRFLTECGLKRFAALIGAVAYSGAFAHIHLILWKGALPQSLTLCLLPLAFLLAEQSLRATPRFGSAWAGLTIVNALLFINHQATGMMAGIFLSVYIGAGFLLGRWPWPRLGPLILSGILSLSISLFAILPILMERQWVMMYQEPELLVWATPTLEYLKKLLVWSNTYAGAKAGSAAYLGLTVVVLGLLGAWQAFSKSREPAIRNFARLILIVALLSLGLRGAHVRDIIFTLFATAALAAVAVHALIEFLPQTRLPAILLALLLLDIGTTAIQPLARTDKAYFDTGAFYLLDTAPTQRILMTNSRAGELSASIGPGGPPLHYFPVQQLIGAHSLTATLAHNYVAAIIKMAEHDLQNNQALSKDTESLLDMLNVGRIINDKGAGFGLPASIHNAIPDGPLGLVIKPAHPFPLVFSRNLTEQKEEVGLGKPLVWNEDLSVQPSAQGTRLFASMRQQLTRMAFDPVTHSALTILTHPGKKPDWVKSLTATEPAGWHGNITNYQVSLDRIRLTVDSRLDGYVQIGHPWYPYLKTSWNGKPIESQRSQMNLMVLPVRSGVNDYLVTAERSSTRIISGWFSFIALCLVMAIAVAGKFFAKQRSASSA